MNEIKKEPDYEECIVTFIDILGFRALLHEKTAAEIHKILESFRYISEPIDNGESMESFESRFASGVAMEVVSDGVIRARTIHTEFKDGALFNELLDLVHIQAGCLYNGILIRGALTIDYVHVGESLTGPIFGQGLVEAYEMGESEAIYPRIVIDDKVIDCFRKNKSLRKEGHSEAQEKKFVMDLLKSDGADPSFIDYLGAIKRETEDDGEYLEFLDHHRKLIQSGLSKNYGGKVWRKYNWLKNYHNNQLMRELKNSRIDEIHPELEGTLKEFLEPLILR